MYIYDYRGLHMLINLRFTRRKENSVRRIFKNKPTSLNANEPMRIIVNE